MQKVFAFTAGLLFCVSAAHGQDYMSAELRASVEKLKQEVAAQPSDNGNAQTRARVMWEWINAFSLTGRHVPPNATLSINVILGLKPDAPVSLRLRQTLDNYVYEFALRDENPEALGTIEMETPGPFPSESFQTLRVTYTVGELGMAKGGVIVLGRHFISSAALWQRDDPVADNYVSIRSSHADAAFADVEVPIAGMHGGSRGQVAYRLDGTSLAKGDTVTITYGDTSGGGAGYRLQSYSNDGVQLPIYADLEGNGYLLSLPIATYEVVGKEVFAFHGFAPSVLATDEKFDLTLRAEDLYYNRATGPIPAVGITLNGESFMRLPEGGNPIQILTDLSFENPGVYRFAFASPDGSVSGVSNPIWVQDDPQHRIYWGETHGHSGFAEGAGSADGYFEFGRDDAKLDFLTLSEHDVWMDDFEWKVINDAVARFSEEGKFILYPGYEWSNRRAKGGHHNVFFRRAGMDRVPVQDAPVLTQLFLQLHEKHDPQNVLVIPHAHQLGDWRISDVYVERLVEIMSMHGTFDWFGDKYLQAGREVGFVGASDDHMGHPGYSVGGSSSTRQRGGLAAVYSPELSTDSVFDALRNRQAYATSGARIIIDANLNGNPMGVRQAFAAERRIEARVMGTSPIDKIDVIKNGTVITTQEFAAAKMDSHVFVQVSFASQSESTGRDNPRGYRPWEGVLEVSGATLKGVESTGFQDRRHERARVDSEDGNKVNFVTATRGRANNIVIELDGVSKSTSIRIQLEQTVETGTAPIRVRRSARIPSADVNFDFAKMEDGRMTHEFQVGRYRDHLGLRLINPESPLDQNFEFKDSENPLQGDYYYLRVRQL
ncbi:MAG: DUF3604 domain-containing protein, partial [Candidatus Hydrogenedentes bacterium]|nr:DUF3604 domain-containing protein [Candidatus Hydrogenedentota bacterium]